MAERRRWRWDATSLPHEFDRFLLCPATNYCRWYFSKHFEETSCQQQVQQNHKRTLRQDQRTKTSEKAKRKTKLQSKKASYSSRYSFCCHYASLERFSSRCFVLERNCPTKISLGLFQYLRFFRHRKFIDKLFHLLSCKWRVSSRFQAIFSWNKGEISNAQSVTEPRVPRCSLSPLSPVDLGNINQSSLYERDE